MRFTGSTLTDSMDPIEIVRGITMPFYPMRPASRRTLKSKRQLSAFYAETKTEPEAWVCQPKLNGIRACLGVVEKCVYVQNDSGGAYSSFVKNVAAFRKLPDRTCLDGEIVDGCFYPFECLAVGGHSFIFCTANEREVMAYQLMRLINQPWLFDASAKDRLSKRQNNLPDFKEVVMKQSGSAYELSRTSAAFSSSWLACEWS